MEADKTGWLSKIINVLFFKLPWYIYVALLIGGTAAGTLLASIPIVIFWWLGALVGIFVPVYAIIALVLQLVMKASGSKNYVDLAYALFYKRSYLLLFAIIIVSGLGGEYFFECAHSVSSPDFLGQFCYLFLSDLMVALVVVFFYGIFAIPIKFILRRTGWCPACGRFFALQTTSRGVIDTQEINVKKTVDTRNSRGQVIGQQDQYVSGTREIIQKVKTCKYCGSTLTSTKARDYANV